MKKLSLKKLNLESTDLLQKEQLKTILGANGGYGGNHGAASVTCYDHNQMLVGHTCASPGCWAADLACIDVFGWGDYFTDCEETTCSS